MTPRDESGFTLVEAMVAIFLLSVLSVGFYQVMFAAVRGSSDTADIAEVAEEARLGFNRMIRDTRETTKLVTAGPTLYRIWVDFDGDGCVDAGTAFVAGSGGTCAAGGTSDYEYLAYAYTDPDITLTALNGPSTGLPANLDPAAGTVTGTRTETLASSVDRVTGKDVFSFVSNFLQFDTTDHTGTGPRDGEVSVAEIEAATPGANDGALQGVELDYVSDVNYAFRVVVGGDSRTFYGQAQIRNRRYSNL